MKGDSSRIESRKNTGRASGERIRAETGGSSGDRVQISASTRDAAAIHKTINQTPDVRADKVSEVKERIESGTYEIDPSKIADKMIASFMEENL